MTALFAILTFQAILGALDMLLNHEWREHLPSRPGARLEQALHAAREWLYGMLFLALGWAQWQGHWAWLLAAVLLGEILLTAWDFVEEDRTRVLSPNERVMHLVLSMGAGAVCTLMLPMVLQWSRLPDAVVLSRHGYWTGLFTLFAIGVWVWAVRDTWAAITLYRLHKGVQT